MKKEKEIVKEIPDYKKGAYSKIGKITKIFWTCDNYVLYEVDNLGDVILKADDTIDLDSLNIINPNLTKLNTLLASRKDKKKFAGQIAIAYKNCFDGKPESGAKFLEDIYQIALKYKILKSKVNYMSSTLLFVIINILISGIFNTYWVNLIDKQIILLFTIATFGSFGGILSVLTKIPTMEFELRGSNFIQLIDSFSRIFISMVSSVIIFVFIKSDIIFGSLNHIDNNCIFYSFAIVSGFSEKFIPKIIKSIEKNNNTTQNNETPNA